MRFVASIAVLLALLQPALGQTAGGSLGVGVVICGDENASCKPIKKKRKAIARSGFVPVLPARRLSFTCGAAELSLVRAGFQPLGRIDCAGRRFTYLATRRGQRLLVDVEAVSGRILRVRPAQDGTRRRA